MDISKLSDSDLSYMEGFVKTCAEHGVDAEALLKSAEGCCAEPGTDSACEGGDKKTEAKPEPKTDAKSKLFGGKAAPLFKKKAQEEPAKEPEEKKPEAKGGVKRVAGGVAKGGLTGGVLGGLGGAAAAGAAGAAGLTKLPAAAAGGRAKLIALLKIMAAGGAAGAVPGAVAGAGMGGVMRAVE